MAARFFVCPKRLYSFTLFSFTRDRLSNRHGTNSLNLRRYFSALLAFHQLVFACAMFAQQRPATAKSAAPSAPKATSAAASGNSGIKILILEGQHATNSVQGATAIPPVLEIRDENDLPIEGATVTFQLPQNGPGGFFPGQKLTLTTKTDFRGQVGATGLVPNEKEGTFHIHVTVTEGARTAEATITQTNSASTLSMAEAPRKKSLWRSKYVLIGAGAAVAATLVIVLTHGSSKNPTVTITAGPVTVNQ
jgi:hypothetical protein